MTKFELKQYLHNLNLINLPKIYIKFKYIRMILNTKPFAYIKLIIY